MRGCEWGDSWYVREFGGEEGGIEGGERWRGRDRGRREVERETTGRASGATGGVASTAGSTRDGAQSERVRLGVHNKYSHTNTVPAWTQFSNGLVNSAAHHQPQCVHIHTHTPGCSIFPCTVPAAPDAQHEEFVPMTSI